MGSQSSKPSKMADWRQVINEADIGTARLIVQLQMQDAAALTVDSINTHSQSAPDAALARKIFESELKEIQGQFPDRALSELVTFNENNREAEFECAAFDWKFNEFRNTVDRVPAPPPPPPPPPVQLIRCVACTDNANPNDIVRAPCGHNYCRDCLQNLFSSSMKDETLYPPRCCKRPIPLGDARKVLPKDLASEFVNRKDEMETRDRTYCYDPRCSTFIRPYTINGTLARCSRCRQTTCTDCKNQWHFGDCPRDEAVEELLATATENHWRQCPECKRVVELVYGCNHIT